MSLSPVLFLQDVLYGERDLPEGEVPHFFGVIQSIIVHYMTFYVSTAMYFLGSCPDRYHQIESWETCTQFHWNWALNQYRKEYTIIVYKSYY